MAQGIQLVDLLPAYYAANPDAHSRWQARLKRLLIRWAWFLGEQPTVGHLTSEGVTNFCQSMARTDYNYMSIDRWAFTLRRFWVYLIEQGYTTEQPPRPIVPRRLDMQSPEEGSLLHYLDTIYGPEYLKDRREYRLEDMRMACVKLGYCLGRIASTEDLTDANIEKFRQHSEAAGEHRNLRQRGVQLFGNLQQHLTTGTHPHKGQRAPYQEHVNAQSEGTLRHYFETVYAPHKLRGTKLGPNTYRIAMRHFNRYLGREALFTDLTDEVVTNFVYSLKMNAQTANSYRNKITCFWGYCWRKGKVQFGPDVPALREIRPEPVALTLDELSRLFRAAGNYGYPVDGIGGIPAPDFWLSLLMALYDTGARVSAVMSVRMADLDLNPDSPSLLIRGENQKTGKFARRPIHRDTAAILRRMVALGQTRELVWPWTKNRTMLWYYAGEIFTQAGINAPRKFHMLRRTACTFVAERFSVEKARDYLQHDDASTTLKHYIDKTNLDQDSKRMCDHLPRPALVKGGAE